MEFSITQAGMTNQQQAGFERNRGGCGFYLPGNNEAID
jgi:hypothetical protein